MAVQPLVHEHAPPRIAPPPAEILACRWVDRWHRLSAAEPQPGPPVSRMRRWRNTRAALRLIDEVTREIEGYPEADGQREVWRATLRRRLQAFGERRLGWPRSYRDLLLGEEFYAATVEFARAARAFDPELASGDLGQALRNVWIANSLQMLLGLPVAATPSVFAYSMIYPYSDNLLDDPELPAAAKRAFNDRLRRRLEGEALAPGDAAEEKVFALVGRIEEEHPRQRAPAVWESLLAIHRGQVASLAQHRPGLSDEALLATSVAKGGASVLADGFLVAGELTPGEADFCFGYGVALQLLDDLQDVEADLAAGHRTLFTRAAGRGPLDEPASKLWALVGRVVDGPGPFAGPEHATVRDLIRRNCLFLLVAAVGQSRRRFTRRFGRGLESRWPFGFRGMERLRRRLERRGGETARRLRERRGVDSLLDLLD